MKRGGWPGRIKRISYRDQTGSPQEVHQAHWSGFTWEAGRTVVSYCGPWGEVQVWASDEGEGRRVIAHACSVAGIPLTGSGVGEWIVTEAKEGRNGRPGTFQVAMVDGGPHVTKRAGPSGSPTV